MRILIWHVHGSWMTSFVQGDHQYLIPRVDGLGPEGRGRAQTWDWPVNAVEVSPEEIAEGEFDLVIVQRQTDVELFQRWCPRLRLGADVPVIWLEHNTPQGLVNEMVHPSVELSGCLVVHVTNTNALLWDCGRNPTTVIDHGIPDPGDRYIGEIASAAIVVNEPARRARVVGADLIPRFAASVPIDLFGMGAETFVGSMERLVDSGKGSVDAPSADIAAADLGTGNIRPFENVRQDKLHDELPRRRVYLHPNRWTSLGLSLIEAMMLGMPVVALSMTEVPDALGDRCGYVSNDLGVLAKGLRALVTDPDHARELGLNARRRAIERYSLDRFLLDWEKVMEARCA